tara:strand:+ start:1365 stop:1607 length:243 start_codon:yes stop_codon:yes gene_type:complete
MSSTEITMTPDRQARYDLEVAIHDSWDVVDMTNSIQRLVSLGALKDEELEDSLKSLRILAQYRCNQLTINFKELNRALVT